MKKAMEKTMLNQSDFVQLLEQHGKTPLLKALAFKRLYVDGNGAEMRAFEGALKEARPDYPAQAAYQLSQQCKDVVEIIEQINVLENQ